MSENTYEKTLRDNNLDSTDIRDIQHEAEEARRFLYIHGYLNETENRNVSRRIRGYRRKC